MRLGAVNGDRIANQRQMYIFISTPRQATTTTPKKLNSKKHMRKPTVPATILNVNRIFTQHLVYRQIIELNIVEVLNAIHIQISASNDTT